jgi:hypothetical protein
MEPNKCSTGDAARDGRFVRCRTLGQGASAQPAIAPVVPPVAVEGEVKRLKEYLEASQAALEATEQEVQSVCDQLVIVES